MPFPSSLSTPQLDTLRGVDTVPSYAAAEYAIFCPNTVIFQALVNGAPTGASFAQVAFDNVTIGAYTDIEVGETVLIGADSDIRNATFTGRVRKAPTSSILYINETSDVLPDNANIWVIKDFRVWDRLARQVSNVQRKDYDITFTTPAPLIYGLQSAYAGVASGSPEVVELSFTPSGLPITYGATIDDDTWMWTIPSGIAITVGTDTDQNITVEIDAGVRDWITVQVDDSNGKTGYFHFFVGAVASDLSDVITPTMKGAGIAGDENGWSGSVEAFAGVFDLLDNTLIVFFDVEYYNAEETTILSNVKLVGRLRKETDSTQSDELYSRIKRANFDIEGALAQFSRIEHLPFTLLDKNTPTAFDQIAHLTIWRAIAYTLYWHTTYLTLHSLAFDSTADTFRYLALPTQGGNILSVIQDLAVSINALIETAPTGETRVVRDAVYLTSPQRAALPTIMDVADSDLINIDSLDIELVDTTGKIQASGGFYNSTSGKVTPLLSLAPGVAQGVGEGVAQFTRQVLAANVTQLVAQTELNTRTGNEYAIKRRANITMTVSMPPGYNWLVPSVAQWYTFTLSADETTGGRAFTSEERWQCTAVSYQHNNEAGTKSPIQATFKLETRGTPGQTVTYPPVTQISPILPTMPTLPPFPSFPPLPTIILPDDPTPDDTPALLPASPLSNGNLVGIWSALQDWTAPDTFLTNAPTWAETTPDELTMTDFQWVGQGTNGAYAIGNDGTDSVFFYAADGLSPVIAWIQTQLTGLYNKIRVGNAAGQVYAISSGDNWCETFDFTLSDGGFVFAGFGAYTPGVGWTETAAPAGSAINVTRTWVGAVTITSASIDVTFGSDPGGSGGRNVSVRDDGNTQEIVEAVSVPAGAGTYSNSGTFPNVSQVTMNPSKGNGVSSSIVITSLTLCGIGTNPFGGGAGGIASQYSTDFGETFGVVRSAGDTFAAYNGVDTQKPGTAILIGTSGQVVKSTSGGTYSAYGSAMPAGATPAALWLPHFQFGTSTPNAGSTPQFLVASNTLTAGNESLWKVTSSGTVYTDITPFISGEYGIAVSPDCISMAYKSGERIAVIMDFGGTIKLVTSDDAGATWVSRAILAADALYVRFRNTDLTANQLFVANGSNNILVSPSFGANLILKTAPTEDSVIGIEPF